jgi:hypothetical protein
MSTELNNLLEMFLDDVSAENLIELCSNKQLDAIKKQFGTRYDDKIKKGTYLQLEAKFKKIVFKLGCSFHLFSNNMMYSISTLLQKYPNHYSPCVIEHYLQERYKVEFEWSKSLLKCIQTHYQYYYQNFKREYVEIDGLQRYVYIIEQVAHLTQDEFCDKMVLYGGCIIIYNGSYTNNVKVYGDMKKYAPCCFFKEENEYFYIRQPIDFFDVFQLPTKHDRIHTLFELRNILPLIYPTYINMDETISLIDSIVFDLELEWFDYAICEGIFGRFSKLYEIYVK